MDNLEHRRRHTASHILTAAVKMMFPQVHLGVGPSTDEGFYQDFDFGEDHISDELFKKIEKKMRWIVNKDFPIVRKDVDYETAKSVFANDPFKQELIEDLKNEGETVFSFYDFGDGDSPFYRDLCAGPHLESTGQVGVFKLTKLSGAYWRGDEKNPQLTRVYGVAFDTQEKLDTYLHQIEEAKKRDHRKLGRELDLFHMDDHVGLGLPLWHPKGAILWRLIEDFWYQEHLKGGYDLVRSPHIGHKMLWEASGHWGFYNDSMYPPLEAGQTLEEKQKGETLKESEEYLLKPMNCPFHVQIYKDTPKSYRHFPLRWAECGTVYRFEKKGQLSGLTRVRGFTQDDAHIFCRQDQVEEELKRVIDFILFIYRSFGFDLDTVKVYLSLRDPNNKEKYIGTDEGWDLTESVLRKVAKEKNLDFVEEEGEAAFYGPKLDFKINDCLNREWQCSTLQFDFNLPERFDMNYINDKGNKERPFVLHRALFGSFERFIGLLIEHYAGAFPMWLAPIQAQILPISEKHFEFAQSLKDKAQQVGGRVEILEPSETLGKRIRISQTHKVPIAIIVGDEEMKGDVITIRKYGEQKDEKIKLDAFLGLLTKGNPLA